MSKLFGPEEFASQEQPKHIKVSMYNLAILMHNVVVASKLYDPSGLDASKTLSQFINELNKRVYMGTGSIESALYYSNLLNEEHNFWHPENTSFDTFTKRIMPSDLEFDKLYNAVYYKSKGKK